MEFSVKTLNLRSLSCFALVPQRVNLGNSAQGIKLS